MKYCKLVSLLLSIAIVSSAYAGNIREGRKAYQENCAFCHGEQGRSTMAGAPHFKRGQALMNPDTVVIEHLRRGKNACPSFIGVLDDKKMRDVISFIRTMYP